MPSIEAEPYPFELQPGRCALLIIDMRATSSNRAASGETLGNDVAMLRRAIEPTRRVLAAVRAARLPVIHTREGHRADLADLPPAKRERGRLQTRIGDLGPMGRILVRGEPGHDIVAELAPIAGEPVVDKPGKGAFHATDLDALLRCARRRPAASSARVTAARFHAQHHGAARPTTAVSTAWCWRIASPPISPRSRRPGSR